MRSPETRSKVTPFKTIFHKLISDDEVPIESVSLGLDESFDRYYFYCYFHDGCDLFFTDGPFSDWISKAGHGLISLSISNFSCQSSYKETNILEVISYHCHSLVELTLKNAELCVDDMHPMPLLTRLTLDDMQIHLNKLMECLSYLQVLILVGIRDNDTTDLKIHHLNLKELKWTLYDCQGNSYVDSVTIFAPNLTKLELYCDRLTTVSIRAPLLSYFDLALERADELNVEKFNALKTLRFESAHLHGILSAFPSSTTVRNLTFYPSGILRFSLAHDERIELSNVFAIFPNVTSLTLGFDVWSLQMVCPSSSLSKGSRDINNMEGLKQITIYLKLDDIDKTLTFILYVNGICLNLRDIVLFFECAVDLSVATPFISLCKSLCPKVRFRSGNLDNLNLRLVHLK